MIRATRPILQSSGSMLLNLLGSPRAPPIAARLPSCGSGGRMGRSGAGAAGRRAGRWGGGAVKAGAAVMGTSVPTAAPPNHQATPRKGPVLAIRVIPPCRAGQPYRSRCGRRSLLSGTRPGGERDGDVLRREPAGCGATAPRPDAAVLDQPAVGGAQPRHQRQAGAGTAPQRDTPERGGEVQQPVQQRAPDDGESDRTATDVVSPSSAPTGHS